MRLLSKRDRPLDSATRDDLAAIDAALAGEGDAGSGTLAELALELRADRPVPREQFLAALEERVAEGFPPPAAPPVHASTRFEWPRLRRVLMPALAGGAAVAVVAVAITNSGVVSSDRSRPQSVAKQSGGAATEDAMPATGPNEAAAPQFNKRELGAAAGAPTDTARNRQVERSAEITIGASGNDIEQVATDAMRIADRYRGFVVSSSVSSGSDADAGASIELKIPSERVQDAVADLSKLGVVLNRTQDTQDVTAEFVSLRSRITNAARTRQSLLKQLTSADTQAEAAKLKVRLGQVDAQLAALRAQQKQLRNRVDFSRVSVTVQQDSRASTKSDKLTPGSALDDAVSILGAALAAVLIGLAILAPLALIGAIAWFATTGIRRRRRERVLDEPRPRAQPESSQDDR